MNTSRTRLRWGAAETRDLIAARTAAEAEEKCKCKWKSLVHPCNCKGKETSDADNVDEPATNMRRPHLAVESCASNPNKKLKRPSEDRSFDEFLEDEDEDEEENGNRDGPARSTKMRVARGQTDGVATEGGEAVAGGDGEECGGAAGLRAGVAGDGGEVGEGEADAGAGDAGERGAGEDEGGDPAEKRDALLNTLLDKLIPDGV
uniref:Myb-like domain-containing protein n=1 Tax=Ananas comosus var. bracteatus TaxID=296719 RepID=A0A6V7NQE7_ANACO|nr:unnamed protein product [Ananas comosus var. bracteatus]